VGAGRAELASIQKVVSAWTHPMISRQREAGTHSSRLRKKAGCYCDLFLSLTSEGQS